MVYDMRGTGNNLSKYVTLGLRESLDLDLIMDFIIEEKVYKNVVLWGRSMGAVTIIHYLHLIEFENFTEKTNDVQKSKLHKKQKKYMVKGKGREKKLRNFKEKREIIKSVVLDAPFSNFYKMMQKIMTDLEFSNFVQKMILFMFRRSIKSATSFDVICSNKPIKKVHFISIPALFLIGDKDDLIQKEEFYEMFKNWASEYKKLRIMDNTDHSQCRNEEDLNFAISFCFKSIDMDLSEVGKISQVISLNPPSSRKGPKLSDTLKNILEEKNQRKFIKDIEQQNQNALQESHLTVLEEDQEEEDVDTSKASAQKEKKEGVFISPSEQTSSKNEQDEKILQSSPKLDKKDTEDSFEQNVPENVEYDGVQTNPLISESQSIVVSLNKV